jgi:hypothetical protein
MKRKEKLLFDPKVFLAKVNGGRSIADFRKDQIVCRQGEPRGAQRAQTRPMTGTGANDGRAIALARPVLVYFRTHS